MALSFLKHQIMNRNQIVSREEWLLARKQHLTKEKELNITDTSLYGVSDICCNKTIAQASPSKAIMR